MWEDNIKMDLTKWGVRCGLDSSAQDRDQWWALVNAVLKLWIPYNAGNFLTRYVTISFLITLLHGLS
jgi:hypothetical protein